MKERDPNKPKAEQGIYRKYIVTRTDGQDRPRKKHYKCEYFVLDLTHDPFAGAALLAYADACETAYPVLAQELREKVKP